MAYTKQEFKSGDKLYAAQLNAMDAQIAANEEETMRLSETITTQRPHPSGAAYLRKE